MRPELIAKIEEQSRQEAGTKRSGTQGGIMNQFNNGSDQNNEQPTPAPPERGFHDTIPSKEMLARVLDTYRLIHGDTDISGEIRLVTDGRSTYAVVPTRYGMLVYKQGEREYYQGLPGVRFTDTSEAELREVKAWVAAHPEPVLVAVDPDPIVAEPPRGPRRITLNHYQINCLRDTLDGWFNCDSPDDIPTPYQAMYLDGSAYVLSSGLVFEWRGRPTLSYGGHFIPVGDKRTEEVNQWLVEHPPTRPEERKELEQQPLDNNKDTEALKVLHEIVDPHSRDGILQTDAIKAAKARGVSQTRASRLLNDPSHFRCEKGKSRKDGNRFFPLETTPKEPPEEPEDAGY